MASSKPNALPEHIAASAAGATLALTPVDMVAAAPHPRALSPSSLERERSSACAPLRQQATEEILYEQRGNLDRIRR